MTCRNLCLIRTRTPRPGSPQRLPYTGKQLSTGTRYPGMKTQIGRNLRWPQRTLLLISSRKGFFYGVFGFLFSCRVTKSRNHSGKQWFFELITFVIIMMRKSLFCYKNAWNFDCSDIFMWFIINYVLFNYFSPVCNINLCIFTRIISIIFFLLYSFLYTCIYIPYPSMNTACTEFNVHLHFLNASMIIFGYL